MGYAKLFYWGAGGRSTGSGCRCWNSAAGSVAMLPNQKLDWLWKVPGRPRAIVTSTGSPTPSILLERGLDGASKNETPKSGLGDQGAEWGFCSPIRDTETKEYPRIAAVPRGFEGLSRLGWRRPDWLAGAAGFETVHSG
jgi:hypothetical protein